MRRLSYFLLFFPLLRRPLRLCQFFLCTYQFRGQALMRSQTTGPPTSKHACVFTVIVFVDSTCFSLFPGRNRIWGLVRLFQAALRKQDGSSIQAFVSRTAKSNAPSGPPRKDSQEPRRRSKDGPPPSGYCPSTHGGTPPAP
jgi:hypothetical protein